ncbi:MAG: DUF4390 domain-containing protein [Candidatus Eisenbacteria bacterium]|nr:DUF4390 domain-containing protein [Candidatus Eisenbacteria bacterium]
MTQARALELEVDAPRVRAGHVWVGARLSDLLDEPVVRSLSRGMPATLQLHVELWRRRGAWFDRLENSYDASVRIRYEVWNETYRVERSGATPHSFGTLDSVRALLERPIALPAGRLDRLQPGASYFVAVTATLSPLSVEDVQEVEGWLSGEVETHRHSGFGVFTELPHSLYDAVRNFAGFGDRHARAQTPPFEADELLTPR